MTMVPKINSKSIASDVKQKRRNQFRAFAVLAIAIIFFGISGNHYSVEKSTNRQLVQTFIQNGDLVFRKGRGIFSNIFLNIQGPNSKYSHVGIVCMENREAFVIHTEANELTGVGHAKRDRLTEFISSDNAEYYAFYRINDIDDKELNLVLKTAIQYVTEQISFDTSFDMKSDDSLYCAELVYKAYQSAGLMLIGAPITISTPILGRRSSFEVITVNQLAQSPLIKLISQNGG